MLANGICVHGTVAAPREAMAKTLSVKPSTRETQSRDVVNALFVGLWHA